MGPPTHRRNDRGCATRHTARTATATTTAWRTPGTPAAHQRRVTPTTSGGTRGRRQHTTANTITPVMSPPWTLGKEIGPRQPALASARPGRP